MSEFALNALARKRAELAGECETLQAKLDQLRADLVHLEAAIRIMDPAAVPELIPAKKPGRKGCDWFGRGELGRLALDVLREAQEPLGTVAVARAVMERRGLLAGDAAALRRVEGMVKGALHRREGRLAERVADGPRAVGWRLAGT